MILVVVDDLLFRSKISTAAKGAGVQIAAATSADAALMRARELNPELIILDLDSQKTQPFDVLRRLREDPELAQIRTLGFVSHVHTAAIRDARSAGIDDVMARGAFAADLPQILESAAKTAKGSDPV